MEIIALIVASALLIQYPSVFIAIVLIGLGFLLSS